MGHCQSDDGGGGRKRTPTIEADLLPDAITRLAEAGVEQPRFEAQLLLAQALGVSRTSVIAQTYPPPTVSQREDFARLLAERVKRVPFAYLRGDQEFYGLPFRVTPAVLVPRPETELLVDFVRKVLSDGTESPATMADIGTGSGCIAIAALVHCPYARGVAFDLSSEALRVARSNAERNNVVDRLRLVQGNLLRGAAAASFDIIVSNPPYIPTDEIETLQPEVRDWEPRLALDGGTDGLDLLRELARTAPARLQPGGWIAVELAQGQAPTVLDLFRGNGLVNVATRRDLAGIERIVCGQKE